MPSYAFAAVGKLSNGSSSACIAVGIFAVTLAAVAKGLLAFAKDSTPDSGGQGQIFFCGRLRIQPVIPYPIIIIIIIIIIIT